MPTWRPLTVSKEHSLHTRKVLTYILKNILEFARLPPDQLIEKIKAMHEEIYKLELRESKERTRGKLLGIFDRDRLTKTKTMRN